jgi:hypothetical protein
MTSQYKSIQGIKYERDLLEAAEAATSRGRAMSKADAESIWDKSMDGGKVTPTERRTLEYVVANFKISETGQALLKGKLAGELSVSDRGLKRKGSSYYKQIAGVSYDRQLLDNAQAMADAKGGVLSFEDALHLWGKANDGAGITATERRTLQYVSQQHRLENEAQQFFERSLGFKCQPSLTNGSNSAGDLALQSESLQPQPGFLQSMWRRFMGRSSNAESAESEAKRQKLETPWFGGPAALQDAPSTSAGGGSAAAQGSAPSLAAAIQDRSSNACTRPSSRVGENSCPEADLRPELQLLLSEISGDKDKQILQLECGAAPCSQEDAVLAAQRANAKQEVERILTARTAEEILGRGSKDDQKREFKRLALLLHPDKGLVEADDARASLAMRLAMAALNRTRR